MMSENPMKQLKIGKVVVNISVGASGEPLDNAMTILRQITGQEPCQRVAKQTIRQWGIRRSEPMACIITLRGERADAFLQRAFQAIRNRVNPRSFDKNGNFAFGIKEHIDIPGTRYDPNLGITGMDVNVTLERPGYRVSRRKRAQSKVGSAHRVTPEESMTFIAEKYGVKVGQDQ
ncbi:50S ribosomal protein L5 [Candidatus Bathyarchaeota archaeon]|nr:50S ribosomal protein L5 [Candidatus Bathyarchaeota archaeon]MCK4701967.1 50S ribosomal protein L5 [Candidatus Bathyarchaeota archaeon]